MTLHEAVRVCVPPSEFGAQSWLTPLRYVSRNSQRGYPSGDAVFRRGRPRQLFRKWNEADGLDGGRTQPVELGAGGGPWDPKVSFQPLGVSCQMSLLG